MLWIGLAIGFLVSAGGCTDSGSGHPPVETAFVKLQAQPVDTVAAKVDGRSISADELQTYWSRTFQALNAQNSADNRDKTSQNDEISAEAAIQTLIERELLVAEAQKRGYHGRETLQLPRKQAMVEQLLAREVEATVEAESFEENALKKTENKLRRQLGHPPGLQASHLLVSIPPEAREDASEEQLKQWFIQARKWLGVMRDDLPMMPRVADFYAVRDHYREQLPEPLQLHVNAHLVFPIGEFMAKKDYKSGEEEGEAAEGQVRGEEKDAEDSQEEKNEEKKLAEESEVQTPQYGQDLPANWRRVVPEFGQAATDLARAGRFEQLSDPVKSGFGWHLLVAEKLYPAQVPDAQQLREVATAQLTRQARHQKLVERMREWMGDAAVQTFPQIIAQAHDTQN